MAQRIAGSGPRSFEADDGTTTSRDASQSLPPPKSAYVVYPIVVGLWIAFAAMLAFDPGRLVDLWDRFRDWPLLVQGVVTLLLFPWVVATYVWQTGWPTALRLAIDAVVAVAILVAFFPRRQQRRQR